jgi:uncharacterized protein
MHEINELIDQLKLTKHPEGGFYKETYRSDFVITKNALPSFFESNRNISTSIYFLLPSGEKSLLHRIKSDEVWYYHKGSTLLIYILMNTGLAIHRLGPSLGDGDRFQIIVPANSWFGAVVEEKDSFTLCGCNVAPGFDFLDFELGSRQELLSLYPQFQNEIATLTKAS